MGEFSIKLHTKVIVLDLPPHDSNDFFGYLKRSIFAKQCSKSFRLGMGDQQKKALGGNSVHKTFVFIKKTKSEILKTSFFSSSLVGMNIFGDFRMLSGTEIYERSVF